MSHRNSTPIILETKNKTVLYSHELVEKNPELQREDYKCQSHLTWLAVEF